MSVSDDVKELYEEGRFRAALETLLSEDIDPDAEVEMAYYRGLCHARLGESEEAQKMLEVVTLRDDHLARLYQARMILAWLHVEANDIEKAERQLREVLQEGYESPQAWAALGYCHWRRGREDLALECYRSALDVDDENANARNGLGFLLADEDIDAKEAVALCRQAVESDPENVAYLDSLGWALFKAGRPDEAVRYLTQALARRPGDDIIKRHLEAVRTDELDI